MLLLKGEIWIIDGRKGRLTIRLLDDIDTKENTFFNAELVEGTPRHASRAYDPEEIGDTMTFRTTLTSFIGRSDD